MPTDIPSRFDAQSTADEVIAGVDLSGRLAVVTGGAAGIGRETARALAAAGADTIIAGRNEAAVDAAVADLAPQTKGRILGMELDLMAQASVDAFADAVLALGRPVDLLVLNAGIMASPLARTAEGIESQMASNYVGHALLTSRLAPALVKASGARVIALSSNAHQFSAVDFDDINFERRDYDPWLAYAQSKTASCLLAAKVAKELGGRGVTGLTLHPGGIQTGLLKHVTMDLFADLARKYEFDPFVSEVKTIEQGAATTVWAATEPALAGERALYLEDCHIAEVIDRPNYVTGVMDFALDTANADRLWCEAERMLGRAMPLDAG